MSNKIAEKLSNKRETGRGGIEWERKVLAFSKICYKI
jgi:hypothetical protein